MVKRTRTVFGVALCGVVACVTAYPEFVGEGEPDATSDAPQVSDAQVTDAGVDAPPNRPNTCPEGAGPSMVLVAADGGAFCIDSTEVTKLDYTYFLAQVAFDAGAHDRCAWKENDAAAYTPQYDNDPGKKEHPVNNIDWCSAWSYCRWAGKRLCEAQDEWGVACSEDGARKYPYGTAYEPKKCNDCALQEICDAGDPIYNKTVEVRSLPGCEGGYPGLFDMSGNVATWAEGCQLSTDLCPALGGSWAERPGIGVEPAVALACDTLAYSNRNSVAGSIGVRCCADPL